MWLALFVVVAVVAAGAAAIVLGGRKATEKIKENYARDNQVVPGVASSAPTSWLGSHDPEAKLHRRLIDAIKALHTTQGFDTLGRHLDLRVDIEQAALRIDDELVAASTLPVERRREPLARLSAAVASIEDAVAEVGQVSAAGTAEDAEVVLARVRERTSSLGQAQAALEELDQAQAPAPSEGPEERPQASPGG